MVETIKFSPLIEAARCDDNRLMDAAISAAKDLIAAGDDVNEVDSEGRTALIHTAIKGFAGVAKVLLKAGADPNVRDRKGYTALAHVVICRSNQRARTYLKILIKQKNLDINAQTYAGETGLMLCCKRSFFSIAYNGKGKPDLAAILLAAGANPSLSDKKGLTGLMYAARDGNLKVVEILLEHDKKQNLDFCDFEGKTALMHAVKGGHIEVAERLLEAGASTDLKSTDGKTICDHAHKNISRHLKSLVEKCHLEKVERQFGVKSFTKPKNRL